MNYRQQIEPAAIARFFSSGVILELARRGKSSTLASLFRESGLLSPAHQADTVGEFLDRAFEHLKRKQNRHEYIYKAAITKKILLGTHSLHTASMITEFRVGACKADVVILNGTATVYEVKSERDKLSRLEKQIACYMKVFATINVIVGENHLDDVLSMLPSEVGVLRLSDKYRISLFREAREDATKTCPRCIFDAITLKEAASILADNYVDVPRVPNTQRHRVFREVFSGLAPEVAHRGMVKTLKRSRNLLTLQALIKELPESLHSVSLSTRLRMRDHGRLIAALNTPLSRALQWG